MLFRKFPAGQINRPFPEWTENSGKQYWQAAITGPHMQEAALSSE